MALNTKFGRVDNGRIEYAKTYVQTADGIVVNPTAGQYAAVGFLPVIDRFPTAEPDKGKHWEPSGWEERDGAVRRVYAQVQDPPPPPRTFSKLKCVSALMAAGVWPQVKGYIELAGLYDLFLAAQDFREDNAYFADGRARLQSALGWSDEQVEAVLAASVAGEA